MGLFSGDLRMSQAYKPVTTKSCSLHCTKDAWCKMWSLSTFDNPKFNSIYRTALGRFLDGQINKHLPRALLTDYSLNSAIHNHSTQQSSSIHSHTRSSQIAKHQTSEIHCRETLLTLQRLQISLDSFNNISCQFKPMIIGALPCHCDTTYISYISKWEF